jgi:hypothetical protein
MMRVMIVFAVALASTLLGCRPLRDVQPVVCGGPSLVWWQEETEYVNGEPYYGEYDE